MLPEQRWRRRRRQHQSNSEFPYRQNLKKYLKTFQLGWSSRLFFSPYIRELTSLSVECYRAAIMQRPHGTTEYTLHTVQSYGRMTHRTINAFKKTYAFNVHLASLHSIFGAYTLYSRFTVLRACLQFRKFDCS